jgi:osmotically-inducible protein OsmY
MTQTHIADTELKTAIEQELTWEPGVDHLHIGVGVDQGTVTLSDEVESYPERHLAKQAAMRVYGVTANAATITSRSPASWRGTTSERRPCTPSAT